MIAHGVAETPLGAKRNLKESRTFTFDGLIQECVGSLRKSPRLYVGDNKETLSSSVQHFQPLPSYKYRLFNL